MLIEIHMIQNHSPSNLNRDDLGAPKTCIFGGVPRARISSQCLKRSIRNPGNPDDTHNRGPGLFFEAMQEYIGHRTKFFPDLVRKALDSSSIPADDRDKIVDACTKIAKKEESRGEMPSEEIDLEDRPRLPQLVLLERSEAQEFVTKLAEMRQEKKWQNSYKNWIDGNLKKKALADFLYELSRAYKRRSVDIALFGRMTTSDAFEDVEAAMQVAHAISTHAVVNEMDYFTAVDDLGKTGGGAGHVDEAMFNSACFYKYFCLDWDQLVRNLAGPEPDEAKDKDAHQKWTSEIKPNADKLAACTLGHFLRAAAQTTPTGKQNSYASFCEPCGILVEVKKNGKTPTSYANAFADPVERIGKPDDDAADEKSWEGRSIACLADHVQSMRKAYVIDSTLLWYSPKLWRFPLQYWERSGDGKKTTAKLVTEQRFDVLGGKDGKPKGLVEAVVQEIGFDWSEIKDVGKASAKEG
jgi:CRISPR system Cascade subunit CasC